MKEQGPEGEYASLLHKAVSFRLLSPKRINGLAGKSPTQCVPSRTRTGPLSAPEASCGSACSITVQYLQEVSINTILWPIMAT
ncbi:MAG: hypothetical protein JWM95_2317 [Gemmatimonadetes bacterium]|nr:hypothetical protein [Gemmatimonadota bacterium]